MFYQRQWQRGDVEIANHNSTIVIGVELHAWKIVDRNSLTQRVTRITLRNAGRIDIVHIAGGVD